MISEGKVFQKVLTKTFNKFVLFRLYIFKANAFNELSLDNIIFKNAFNF